MTVDKTLLASMKAEAKKHRTIADKLDATIASLEGLDPALDAAPAAEKKTSTGRGGKKAAAPKAAKPKAAKKSGERKARVPLAKVKEIVQGYLYEQGEQGGTINDIVAFEDSINRAAVTRAIKELGEAGVVTDDGNKRNTRYFTTSAPEPVAEEVEETAADEEIVVVEGGEDESEDEIDPTLTEEPETTPSINFGS